MIWNTIKIKTNNPRDSLRLQNIRLANQSERLAWLVENLPNFNGGSGIIYCQTMAGYLLRKNGSGMVYPFTLAQATGRNIT